MRASHVWLAAAVLHPARPQWLMEGRPMRLNARLSPPAAPSYPPRRRGENARGQGKARRQAISSKTRRVWLCAIPPGETGRAHTLTARHPCQPCLHDHDRLARNIPPLRRGSATHCFDERTVGDECSASRRRFHVAFPHGFPWRGPHFESSASDRILGLGRSASDSNLHSSARPRLCSYNHYR